MWHLTCDTWHVTSDTWHLTCDTGHMTHGMGWWTLWENLLIHSYYGLGMVEKWHATPDTWHVTCDTWQVVSKCIIYPPRKYKTIWLGSKLSIFSKSTSFLLKLDLHCNLPNFRNVSSISVLSLFLLGDIQGEQTLFPCLLVKGLPVPCLWIVHQSTNQFTNLKKTVRFELANDCQLIPEVFPLLWRGTRRRGQR